MNKTERTELKAVVRQQFRVLRQEVDQRGVEVVATAEHAIDAGYADEDEAWANAQAQAHAIALKATEEVNALFRDLPGRFHEEDAMLMFRPPRRNQKKRADLRRSASVDIEAKVAAAKLQLNRQEADLLRDLSMGALESDEARQFLFGIPAAAELVPLSRLAELEAGLSDPEM